MSSKNSAEYNTETHASGVLNTVDPASKLRSLPQAVPYERRIAALCNHGNRSRNIIRNTDKLDT